MSDAVAIRPAINPWLLAAATLDAIAALLHLGCIAFGAPWYRFFGAGEPMAQLAESGSAHPALVTTAIATVLLVWAGYALSGAGAIRRLPLLRSTLCAITSVYLLRGLVGLLLAFGRDTLGRSATFWFWSSIVCLAFGLVHLIGLRATWSQLVAR